MDYDRIKPVPDFPDYVISSTGNIRSLKFGGDKLMKPYTSRGYQFIFLWENGKRARRQIHQLMMLAFVGPRPEGMEVRHLNGNSADNRLENLKYGTHKENMIDKVLHGNHHQSKKTHCPQGHAYDLDNTYVNKSISGVRRICRTCSRVADKKFKLKKKALRWENGV